MDIFKKILEHFEVFTYSRMTLKIHHKGQDFTIGLNDEISGRKIYFVVYVNGNILGKWKKGIDIEADFYKPLGKGKFTIEHVDSIYTSPKTWVSYMKKNFKPEQIELIEF